MNLAIVGSSHFNVDYTLITDILKQHPNATILCRKTKTRSIDWEVAALCRGYGRPYREYESEGPARGGAFVRDLALINDADKIIAIFDPQRVMEGGTAHIVSKALDERKEVEAYTIDDRGEPVLVGGFNPRTDR